ncbi:hybrid sensor histidine kinase/response regulator [Rhodanobacter sp. MP7CTX1]|uniref:hybrid sensor histidine kinase/response regulator n=1 Tax=Rhodanobacter sp. MP7CTX1 TaxID=2723084 RepID=UPI0031B8A70A
METEGQGQVLTDGLLALERAPTSAVDLEACMRAAHSLKGAARIVGLVAAVVVAHAMEDCLVEAQLGRLTLRHGVIDVLLRGVDLIGRIADTPAEDGERWTQAASPEAEAFRAALASALASNTDTEGSTAPRASLPADAAGVAGDEIAERVLRVTASNLNRMLALAGESLVASRWLEPFIRSLTRLKQLQRDTATALDRLNDSGSTDPGAAEILAEARGKIDECQRVLADRVTQLDMFDRRCASVAHRLNDEALASHMRPFADGIQEFRRMVRDLARELGKEAHLEIVGDTAQVDRDVLDKLKAPLTHLLRNAIDHGIESPLERLAAGKPAEGHVRLDAHHIAGLLEISVSDDGQGIAIERVRRAIVARGLADEQTAQRFTEAELLEFLFLPGFTVKDTVSEISGRGVGLDVVQNMVKRVRGSVTLSSRAGQGSRFQLRLPLTTSVVKALVTEIGGEPYAFPLANIVCTATVLRAEVELLEGRQHFQLRGRQVGLVAARQVLEGTESKIAPDQLSVIVVGDRRHEYGLAVDGFRGVFELVVQPLDPRLGKIKDISAGALLDDGSPLLIVDVDDLIQSVERLVTTGHLASVRYDEGVDEVARKRVLVVDDSLTVRELQRKLIENGGYVVEVAVDGVDGWNAVRLGQFDLVVTDIDMPRMDGIELTGLIKNDARLRDVPVMVVSYKDRDEDRRRGLDAGADFYLTKGSFHEDDLLQAVVDLIGEATA